ncbi:hypothetical protein LG905_004980 [Escherichia coli]|nr:hypothetical protein [Escherichia coli]EIS6783063.1 hypothetical protein [Escherichia coli]
MTKFDTFNELITNEAKKSFPEWVTFRYKNNFTEYDESFVYESVRTIKQIGKLEVRNNNDIDFSVKFKPSR